MTLVQHQDAVVEKRLLAIGIHSALLRLALRTIDVEWLLLDSNYGREVYCLCVETGNPEVAALACRLEALRDATPAHPPAYPDVNLETLTGFDPPVVGNR